MFLGLIGQNNLKGLAPQSYVGNMERNYTDSFFSFFVFSENCIHPHRVFGSKHTHFYMWFKFARERRQKDTP